MSTATWEYEKSAPRHRLLGEANESPAPSQNNRVHAAGTTIKILGSFRRIGVERYLTDIDRGAVHMRYIRPNEHITDALKLVYATLPEVGGGMTG